MSKFRGQGVSAKEYTRQEMVQKKQRSEQQYAHQFIYILPDSDEQHIQMVVSKNIPSACAIFSNTYKKAFVLRVNVVPINKEGNVLETLVYGKNTWDVATGNLILPAEKPAEETDKVEETELVGE